jgi:hypothetical protein
MKNFALLGCLSFCVLHSGAQKAKTASADALVYPAGGPAQTETDEYTRYELLAPETASFRIYYEVTATTAGAKYFYNPIRKGSVATDESVTDAMTGKPLVFSVVSGAEARKDPLMAAADLATDYIRVTLARPVPEHGQGRVVILKTYKDGKSYYADGASIVFSRPLGIKRNKVVLPPGYEVVGLTVPSQIGLTPDGRVEISFMHAGAGEAPLVLRAVKDAAVGKGPSAYGSKASWESPFQGPSERARLSERAHQDRDIVYFLQQPETHSFALYHDYTESRAGVNAYANVVRTGSRASDPSAYVVDTGEKLTTQVMSGAAMKAAKLNAGEEVEDAATVVVIPFPAVVAGESRRLRISETYTDAVSYSENGDEFTFDRNLGRPRNAVVLPSGWYCAASAEPATVEQMADGRVRLEFWDAQPEGVDVLVKGRRRVAQ